MFDYYDWIGLENIESTEETEKIRLFFCVNEDADDTIRKDGGALTKYDEKTGLVYQDESWKLEI